MSGLVAEELADRLQGARGKELSRTLREARECPAVAAALKRRADAELVEDPVAALRLARLALRAGLASGDLHARAIGLHALAKAHHAAGRHADAEQLYEQASEALDVLGLRAERARVELARVDALAQLARHDDAEAAARRARRSFLALGDALSAAKVLVNLANLRHAQDRHRGALKLLERARAVFSEEGARELVAHVDLNRANSHSMLADFGASGPLYAAARAAYEDLGREALVALVDYNEAYDLFLQGRVHEARALLSRASACFRKARSTRDLALVDLDEAEMALQVGLAEAAWESATAALEAFTALAEHVPAARAALLAGRAAAARRDLGAARDLLSRARRAFQRVGHDAGVAIADLARTALPLDPPGERVRRGAAAARTLSSLGLARRAAQARIACGHVELERRRSEAALACARSALAQARRLRLDEVELRARQLVGRVREQQGRLAAAAREYARAIEACERLRAGVRSEEDRLAFAADKQEVYADALRVALDLDRVDEAFDLVERSRSRALVDLLAADARFESAALEGAGARARRFAELRRELAAEETTRRTDEKRAGHPLRDEGPSVARLRAELDALVEQLETTRTDASHALVGRPVVDVDELREALGPDRCAVALFEEDGALGAVLVDERRALVRRRTCARTDVERMVRQLHFAVRSGRSPRPEDRSADRARTAAALRVLGELGAQLVAPLADVLGDRHLVVLPPAWCHLVPFHALPLGGRPLQADREVTVAPSATVLAHALRRRCKGREDLVVAHGSEALPWVEREGEAVAALLGARLLRGEEATAAALWREASGARRVHVACHGRFESREPLLSGLELADGRLTVPEMAALPLRGASVTLSACETGVGGARGDEVVGLARALFLAGARSLVVSSWAVDDATTAELMRMYYIHLAAGEGTASALRRASEAVRAECAHPLHWAGFTVLGAWGGPRATARAQGRRRTESRT